MSSAQRLPICPKLLLYAVLDVAGMFLFVCGALWLLPETTSVFHAFPQNSAEAVAATLGGLFLMFWAATRILRATSKRSPDHA